MVVMPQLIVELDLQVSISKDPSLEWTTILVVRKGHFVSYLKARKLVFKGCVYHLVLVNDFSVDIPPIHSVPVVKEIPEVFLDDLLGVPPKREIDIVIETLLDTRPITILPYRMILVESNELTNS